MNKKKIGILMICLLLLSGCTKTLKDSDNKIVKNEITGQNLTENVVCRPTNEEVLKLYEDNKVDLSKLPECEDFTPITTYESIWTSFFVKPLAWVIIKIGNLVNSYGLSIIITCLLIRLALFPVTKKTAIQSENMQKAQPELQRLEKKYANKTSQEDQTKKAQEMMMIYQKYHINPISGCLLAFVQIPLLFAFLEAINRTPAIFENKFLSLHMGTTITVGISNGNWWYLLLLVLIMATTYISFRKTLKDQSAAAQQMKFTIYFMLVIILIASFSLPVALGIYWITSSLFTILQNLWVERR